MLNQIKLSSLVEECTNDLEPYSRFLGRKDNDPNSLAALALLPKELMHQSPAAQKAKSQLAQVCAYGVGLISVENLYTINRLQLFQKRLKYGLPTETTIALYELGFSDRVIAQDLAASLNLAATQKKDLVKALNKDRDGARAVMEKYPIYFQERMNELLQ